MTKRKASDVPCGSSKTNYAYWRWTWFRNQKTLITKILSS